VSKAYGVLATAGQDITAPSIPSGLTLTQNVFGSISFTWNASTPGTNALSGYQIYRNGTPLSQSALTQSTDATVAQSTAYSYQVSAFDVFGNNSALSSSLDVTSIGGAVPVWSAVPAQAIVANQSFQLELSSYVTGATSYSVQSGTLPSGLTLNPTTGRVSGTATAAITASVVFRATNAAGGANSATTDLTVYLADTQAPTVPRALAASSTSTQVTFRAWQSCDKRDSTHIISGVSAYRRYRNGVRILPDLTATANSFGPPTHASIGTAGGTLTMQGPDWDQTGAGISGLDTTSDSIDLATQPWARGDVTSATVAALTSPDSGGFPGGFGGGGPMVRESTAPGAKFVAAYYTFNNKIYAKWRGTTNGAVSEFHLDDTDGVFRGLHIDSLSDGTFVFYYENSSGVLVPFKTTTTAEVNLASTGIHGTFVFSLTANAASAQFRDVAFRSRTTVDYTITTSTSETVEFEAVDAAGNVSAKSTAVTAQPSSSSVIKFNPGMGAHLDPAGYSENPTRRALDFATIDELGALPFANRLHIQIKRRWSSWEGATRGDYAAGLEMWTAYANRCALYGMHLHLCFVERAFGTSGGAAYFPAYLSSSGSASVPSYFASGGPWSGGLTATARIDTAPTMDAIIDLFTYFGGQLNSHPSIESICMEGETANGNPTVSANTVGVNTQLKRWITASRLAWPNTGMRVYCNFHYPYTLDLYEHCLANKCGIGGPDPELTLNPDGSVNPVRLIDGNEWARGLGRGGAEAWHAPFTDQFGYTTKDYRDLIPWFGEQQGLGTGGIDGFNQTATEIDNYQRTTMKARYIFFPRANEGGQYAANQSWSGAGGYLSRITAAQGRVAFETKPTSYP
jgi:hypothetical protein